MGYAVMQACEGGEAVELHGRERAASVMLKSSWPRKTWPAWAVLGVGLLATVFASLLVKQRVEQDAVRQFAFASDQVTLKIQERLGAYALILRGAAALFAASNAVDRQQWRAYVETLRPDGSVPGVQGIGFAQVIPADELAAHIARIRSEGFREYTVRPSGERAIYTSIIYLEPFRGRNVRAFGFDMLSEPVRRAAMEQARDTGEAALSGKVELVQETGTEVQAGTLMYVPVYRNGMPRDTLGQRQAALIGWAYSPYRMNDLMAGILQDWESHEGRTVDLHIYDGLQATPASLLMDSNAAHTPELHSLFYQQRMIDFNGHRWLLVFDHISIPSGISYATAWSALTGGLALSGLLFGLMLSLINERSNAARISKLIDEIMRREELLKESEYRWKFAIEGSRDGVWDWNIQTDETKYSKRCKEMLGYAEDDILPTNEEWFNRIYPDDQSYVAGAMQAYLDGKTEFYVVEYRFRCKDGSYKWILGRGMVVSRSEDGKPLRMIGTHSDITERKQMEDQVRQLAFYDTLTELPNRRLLDDRLSQTMAATKRSGCYGAVMFLDLDNFKPLNDTHGHEVGDLLLIEAARRLKSCVRETDTVARFGGDEFVVLLSDLNTDKTESTSQAGMVAEKIRFTLSAPYLLTIKHEGKADTTVEHHCTASIGVALFINHGASQDDIFNWADTAMYQAKKAGRNLVRFYDAKA
jgi:diguanylate cyclase (GGDEF)-like protein/PAS domain S-box-containing protein